MKNIAIFDLNGKANRFIASEALDKGYKLKVFVENTKNLVYFTHYLHKNVEIYEGIIRNSEVLKTLLSDCELVINSLGNDEELQPLLLLIIKNSNIKNYIEISPSEIETKNRINTLIYHLISKFSYKNKTRELWVSNKAFAKLIVDRVDNNKHNYKDIIVCC